MSQQKQSKTAKFLKIACYILLFAAVFHFSAKYYMGYRSLEYKYTPIYFTAWRQLEDKDLGTVCFVPLNPFRDSPKCPEVDRYVKIVQPEAPKMNNSIYQDFRPDIFVFEPKEQYKLFKTDIEVKLEEEFLKARLDFMKTMIKTHVHHHYAKDKDGKIIKKPVPILNIETNGFNIVNENVVFSKKMPYDVVQKSKIRSFLGSQKAQGRNWIVSFNDLISKIRSNYSEYSIISGDDKNKTVEFAEKLEKEILNLISEYNQSVKIESSFKIEDVKSFVYSIITANPKNGRNLHVISRIYYLYLYVHSAFDIKSCKTIKVTEFLDSIAKYQGIVDKEADPNTKIAKDNLAKIKEIESKMKGLRITYLNTSFTYLIARMIKTDPKIEFPFDSTQDKRGWFARVFGIHSLKLNEKNKIDIEIIEDSVKRASLGFKDSA